jgi:uncharacterized membrane protein YphA (DoxX/SURF4 family)
MNTKKINIIYWIFTGILLALMGLGAIPDLLSMPDALAEFKRLGYPEYLSAFMGAVKILGVIAILIPGYPRIKEWVYAGFVFDITGATYSNIASGTPIVQVLPFLIGYTLIIVSYIYHHKRLKAKQA